MYEKDYKKAPPPHDLKVVSAKNWTPSTCIHSNILKDLQICVLYSGPIYVGNEKSWKPERNMWTRSVLIIVEVGTNMTEHQYLVFASHWPGYTQGRKASPGLDTHLIQLGGHQYHPRWKHKRLYYTLYLSVFLEQKWPHIRPEGSTSDKLIPNICGQLFTRPSLPRW